MTQSGHPSSEPDPELLHLFLDSRSADPAALRALDDRLAAHPTERGTAAELDHLWQELGGLPPPLLRLAPASEPVKLFARSRARWVAPVALAASLAAVMTLTPLRDILPLGHPTVQTRYVAGNDGRRVTMPDGSSAVLAAGAALHLSFDGDQRLVTLDRGEAFFQVAHDKARPFLVRTREGQTRAVGTAFDVRRDPAGVVVTVTEGIVQVRNATGAVPHQVIAGQQVRYDVRSVGPLKAVNSQAETSWTSGTLEFNGAPLDEVIDVIDRHCICRITLHQPRLAKMRISAILKTGDAKAILAIVRAQANLSEDALNDAIEVTPSR